MSLNFLVDAVIDQYDWNKFRVAEGTAAEIPAAFRELLAADSPDAAVVAYWKFENHIVVQGSLFDAAVGVVSLIGAALVETSRPKWVKIQLLEILFQIVNGEGPNDLGQRCRNEAKKLLWILYGVFQEGGSWRAAREIIERVDDDHLIVSLDRINRQNGRIDTPIPLKI